MAQREKFTAGQELACPICDRAMRAPLRCRSSKLRCANCHSVFGPSGCLLSDQRGTGRNPSLSSRHRGVYFVVTGRSTGKWCTQIAVDGKVCSLGSFDVEADAARQYEKARDAREAGRPLPPNPKRATTSLHRGVSWNKSKRKWIAQITTAGDGQRHYHHLGCFNEEADAVRQYELAREASEAGQPLTRALKRVRHSTSQHRGVSWNKTSWRAQIAVGGKPHHLGNFSEEADAARQYELAREAIEAGRPLPPRPRPRPPERAHGTSPRPRKPSQRRGVYWHKPKNKWVAQIAIGGKLRHLGCFSEEADAARQYEQAQEAIKAGRPLPPKPKYNQGVPRKQPKTKSTRKPRKPRKPRIKGRSPYQAWKMQNKQQFTASNPNDDYSTFSKKMKVAWDALSEEEQAPFKQESEKVRKSSQVVAASRPVIP
jgi:hypothetical protein